MGQPSTFGNLSASASAYLVRMCEYSDLGWDDSLFHDLSLGHGDFDDNDLISLLEKEAGVLLTEKEGSLYYPATTWYHGIKSRHSQVLRLSVFHLDRVFAERRWSAAGTTEREQVVERTISMVRAATQTDKVRLRMQLNSKLGLHGERAEAFFWHFSESFGVDLTGADLHLYFPSPNERGNAGIDRMSVLPFLVRDLIPLALERKWSEPGTRDDLLIAWKP